MTATKLMAQYMWQQGEEVCKICAKTKDCTNRLMHDLTYKIKSKNCIENIERYFYEKAEEITQKEQNKNDKM